MRELKIRLPDELEKRFRMAAFKKFGYKKGAISLAAEETIRLWINKNS